MKIAQRRVREVSNIVDAVKTMSHREYFLRG